MSFVRMERSLRSRKAACTADKDRFTSDKSGNFFMLGLDGGSVNSCVVREPTVCTKTDRHCVS